MKKSVFDPSPVLDFLGFTVDTRRMTLSLPREKVEKACRHMRNQSWTSPRKLAHLIGLLMSTLPAVLPAPLHYRALQRTSNLALSRYMDYDRPCRLLPQAKLDLEWWIQSLSQHNGRNIVPPTAHLVMTYDASLEGWGAT